MRFRTAALFAGLLACGQDGSPLASPTSHGVDLPEGRVGPAVPVFGGTVAGDDDHFVVADPARGAVAVWTAKGALVGVAGLIDAQPFRVALGAERFLVTLRGTGEVAAFDYQATLLGRVSVCPEPRGIDLVGDRAVVACASGELVELQVSNLEVQRSQWLVPDLRDVVMDGPTLWLSRFRSAEVWQLSSHDWAIDRRVVPALEVPTDVPPTAHVAWRMRSHPDGGVTVLHQSASNEDIDLVPGNDEEPDDRTDETPDGRYTGVTATPESCVPEKATEPPLVTSHLTRVDPTGGMETSEALPNMVLPTDFAFFGPRVVLAGGRAGRSVTGLSVLTEENDRTCTKLVAAAPEGFVGSVAIVDGRPVGFARGSGDVVTLDSMSWEQLLGTKESEVQPLQTFHRNSEGGITCANCHPEGTQDGHTWAFNELGARRTQDLTGGLASRAPFHWEGTLPTADELMVDVMEGAMGGPFTPSRETAALFAWLDRMPSVQVTPRADEAEIALGKEIFRRADVACNTCHLGAQGSDHSLHVVRDGEVATKTPSLRGLASRAPFMHDGCASTLLERFTDPECGGGDAHGTTSHLSAAEIDALVAYLSSM